MSHRVHLDIVRAFAHADPCAEPWDAMRGDVARRCARCARDVHDLASLTASEAVGLLTLHGGALCLRIRRRPDGVPVTRDRLRAPRTVGALAVAALALAAGDAHAQDAGAPVALEDRDGDGVPDAADTCPTEPAAPPYDPHRAGCPPGLAEYTSLGVIRIAPTVRFAARSARITGPSLRTLRAVADALAASPQVRRVRITGHASRAERARGDIGLRRAESVRAWLVAHGVAAARLEVVDGGTAHPATDARDRRVEFDVSDPAPAAP